jgi:hypothetical protein
VKAADVQSFIGQGSWLWRKPPGAVRVRVTLAGSSGTTSRYFAARDLRDSYRVTIAEPAGGGDSASVTFATEYCAAP